MRIAFLIMPKDVANFLKLLLLKLDKDIENIDSEKKSKIMSIKIDFEYRN